MHQRLILILVLSIIHLSFTAAAVEEETEAAKAAAERVEKMRKLAKKGHVQGQLQLAAAYFHGRHSVERDYTLALHWFNKAAEQGSAVGHFNVGICYERGLGAKKDVLKALDFYRKAADQDLEQAQVNASAILIDLNLANEAEDYLRKAAAKGNTYAEREYARLLLYGRDDIRDVKAAELLLKKAIEAGDSGALLLTADLYSGTVEGVPADGAKMFDYLWTAAARDIPEAMSKVGYCYEEGIGTNRDTTTAVKWYRKAAEAGHPQAMINLAHCCNVGKGTEHDPKEAVRWFFEAAKSDNKAAQIVGTYNLGVAYATGSGVALDDDKAYKLFLRAAEAGYAKAQYNVGVFCEEGRGTDSDAKAAVRWYTAAAQQGEAQAVYTLATCYLDGTGVAVDRSKARELLLQASDAGNSDALKLLKLHFPTP